VIGGADTGCQMASIFADFGVDVRLIEAGPRLVPGADVSISAALRQAFAARGAVGIARYDDLVRPVADGHPDGFCKLIADRRSHLILGAHVLGEYSAETVQVVAAAMSAGLNVEQLAEIQFAFPTFTEAVSMAAQIACRTIGIGRFPPSWSYLGSPE
jgi:pyruvate/2-oxoglutarate dehydrogenase complex dihydrolipoamide dehydrogenase (E3) component